MRFLTSGFFHESLVPGSWIHMLKYFRYRRVIHEIRFIFVSISGFQGNDTRTFSKKTTFVNIPWNLGKNQQIFAEILGTFLGIVIRKLIDFWVTIPGSQLISGYRNPEVKFCEKIQIFLFLNSWTTFKTDITYGCLVHALVYDLKLIKNGVI